MTRIDINDKIRTDDYPRFEKDEIISWIARTLFCPCKDFDDADDYEFIDRAKKFKYLRYNF